MKALLNLDQAATTGWSLLSLVGPGPIVCPAAPWKLQQYGAASRTLAAVEDVLTAAAAAAGDVRELAVVLEDHSKVPARYGHHTATLLGMGAARGYWEHALDVLHHPKVLRYRVTPAEWRVGVFGARGARLRTEAAKAEAVRWARALTSDETITAKTNDVAEAICISAWSALVIPARIERDRAARAAKRKE